MEKREENPDLIYDKMKDYKPNHQQQGVGAFNDE
jgi:hypothetical protein